MRLRDYSLLPLRYRAVLDMTLSKRLLLSFTGAVPDICGISDVSLAASRYLDKMGSIYFNFNSYYDISVIEGADRWGGMKIPCFICLAD